MKIRNVTINSFGKLQNYSLDLNQGLNVVYGENEYGKSTIMAFIKLMFYGKHKSGSVDSKDLRKKYVPWNGLKMSGSMTIEYKGKIYKIQKEISSRSSGYDKTTVYNLSEGKMINLAKNEEVGEYFLGIDAVGFERSSYIKNIGDVDFQLKNTKKANKDTVLDKILSNLASGGEEDISQSEVLAGVEGAMSELRTVKGKGGALPKLDKDIEDLEIKINRIKEFEKSQEGEKIRRKNLETLIEEQKRIRFQIEKADNYKRMKEIEDVMKLVAEKETLREKSAESGINPELSEEILLNLENYDKELCEIETSIKHYEGMNESRVENFVKITQAEEDYFKEQMKICNELMNEPENSGEAQRNIEELRLSRDKKSEEICEVKKKYLGKHRFFVISGFVSLLLSITAIIFNFFVPSLVLSGVFVGFICWYLISKNKMKIEEEFLFREIKCIDSKIETLTVSEMDAIRDTREREYNDAIEKMRHLLNEKKCKDYNDFYQNRALTKEQERYENVLAEFVNKREDIFKRLRVYLSSNNIAIDLNKFKEYLKELHCCKEKYDELSRQINYKARVLGLEKTDKCSLENLLNSFTFEDSVCDDGKNVETLRLRLEELNSMNLYDSYKESNSKILNHSENLETLNMELSNLNEKQEKMLRYYDCLSVAKDVLEETISEMRYVFSPKLNDRASEIFKALTCGKYDSICVDKDYRFVVGDKGINRSSDYFSSGTIDQAYLALRIAISELISSERVPFLFDDTLMQYDDRRLDEVIKFLKDYADKNDAQSIIFTCHKAVSERVVC